MSSSTNDPYNHTSRHYPEYKTERDPYSMLKWVLDLALRRASCGKGKERHAKDGQAFEDQPMLAIGRMVGIGGPLFQCMKKLHESTRLDAEGAKAELLDVIVYAAGTYLLLCEEG